ncbi:hypothetical protein GOV13_01170 [Candidatus Pacearchaeota archaeon]|nr:hypothetical protein [Candidatus Pacearchaeota archaeon]
MILYFDNLITNIPLNPGVYTKLDSVRDSCKAYSNKDRYDVTLYTLASYAEIDWDEVVIVYEFGEDMIEKKEEFERFVKDFWPNAHIFYGRSDNQKKFQKRMNFINKLNGEWVFYAGNNDHPFVAPNKKILNSCLDKAKQLSKKHKFISVVYCHFWEAYHTSKKGSAYREYMALKPKILEETPEYFVDFFYEIYGDTIQIFNKKMINYMVFSEDLGEGKFRKIEEMTWHDKMKRKRVDQIAVVPKEVICDHFDGYGHTVNSAFPVPVEYFPPLFIPKGFFENNIKIRYGYKDYKEGWVNINPLIEKYSFEDEKGTDMKISIDEIPLFWKKRISKIDINPNLNKEVVEERVRAIKKLMRNSPEPIKNQSFLFRIKFKIVAGNYVPYFIKASLRKNNLIKKFRRNFYMEVHKKFKSTLYLRKDLVINKSF